VNGRALYNEIDDFAADWLENLIRAGLIAPGRVERRSIVDLTPDDLAGYLQVHLFAGIGIWSASLRDAGQRDDAPWWTASCPCPPFSAAGKKKSCPSCGGTNPVPHVGRTGYFVCCVCGHSWLADDRHLWPEVWRLTRDCRPTKLAGEQVAGPDGQVWLSSVRASLEILGYGVGASDLCAPGVQVPAGETTIGRETIEWIRGSILTCPDPQLAADLRDYAEWFEREVGIGAPHIRQRLFWVADANGRQRNGITSGEGCERDRTQAGRQQGDGELERRGEASTVAYPDRERCDGVNPCLSGQRIEHWNSRDERPLGSSGLAFFSECDWIVCTDGQARPVEVGTFPLAHGEPARVGKLRAYGNQIFRPLAAQFILAADEAIGASA
jgi:DNA (cytosine-5)-methyltransferase 1